MVQFECNPMHRVRNPLVLVPLLLVVVPPASCASPDSILIARTQNTLCKMDVAEGGGANKGSGSFFGLV
jgi:hypothetical protein